MSQEPTMKCQVFVDPLYGSERYVTFEPGWVVEAKDGSKSVLLRRAQPVTFLTFANGESHVVHGHWAQRIAAAKEAAQPEQERKDS